MELNFDNITVKTVTSNYSWDGGIPNQDSLRDGLVNQTDIIGYAPYVNVQLETSLANIDENSLIFKREANFNDYYNSETNTESTQTTGSYTFGHTYLMPGEYVISVEQIQYVQLNSPCADQQTKDWDLYSEQEASRERYPYSWMWYAFMQEDNDPRTEVYGSLEAGGQCLTWEDCEFQGPKQVTWDETVGPAFEVRSRDVSWRWKKVICNPVLTEPYTQKIPWYYTKQNELLPRTWKQIQRFSCNDKNCLEAVPQLSANQIVKSYEKKLKVLEILPDAYLTVVEQVTGSSFIARLSPKFTRCGSFPIEKIIWDLGDGTPIFEVTRLSDTTGTQFVYNNEIEKDSLDPRNYDVVHTYNRNIANASCFYPSITAVASCTSSTGKAATIVGPVQLEEISSTFNIIQTELTDKGKVYIGQIKDQIVFWNVLIPPPLIVPAEPQPYLLQLNKAKLVTTDNEDIVLI